MNVEVSLGAIGIGIAAASAVSGRTRGHRSRRTRRTLAHGRFTKSAIVAIAALLLTAPSARSVSQRHAVHAKLGAIRAELSYRQARGALYWDHGRFRIWKGRRQLVDRRIRYGATFSGRPIAVLQLDGIGQPEVLLTEFTGGNGCCWTNWIYAGARRIRAPWLYLPASGIRDADGDSKPEFHGTEPRWWGWSARADDRSPVKVWTFSGGKVHDVTRSFPADVQADQADQYAFFQSSLTAGNVGAARNGLAAYVADGYSLGQGDAAMATLQAAVAAGQLDDPDGVSTAEYLDTLRRLLRDRGYTA